LVFTMSLHKPVLLKETIELLNLKANSVVIDATLGGGGHALEILDRIGEKGKLVAIDLDKEALDRFELKIKKTRSKIKGRIFFINDNFANLESILADLQIEHVDAIIADLGWSSDQLEGRGMSFQIEEPLDMRLGRGIMLTAREIINEYPKDKLEAIIQKYGEEKFYRRIAGAIDSYRIKKQIETTTELAEIIKNAVPERFRRQRINPATRTFQAIRIEVNRELENLEKFISLAIDTLNPEGRLAIITFHSLEDRIVKKNLRENARGCICPISFPICKCGHVPKVRIITKKPMIADKVEIQKNRRSRSAKLRVCERLRTAN
jgi:16S rRNA (cytosine1402-N4)-methyltransferase